jgi:hypothetical protein
MYIYKLLFSIKYQVVAVIKNVQITSKIDTTYFDGEFLLCLQIIRSYT